MAQVTMRSLNKMYDEVHAVKDVNLDIRDKEFVVLVGPSGCGKTTTLRMVAGLESITSGRVLINDKVVNELAPMDRDIAMVFQNYALYPHMSVYDNMAFGLKMRKFDKPEIQKRVREAADVLGIGAYAGKPVTIGLRPEDMRVARDSDPPELNIPAVVEVVERLGSEILLDVAVGSVTMVASVEPISRAKVHEQLQLAINPERLHFFDAETEAAI